VSGPESSLLALLGLEEQFRHATTPTELAFALVNECRTLVEYRQAVLFIDGSGLRAVSGVASLDRTAPFALWMERVWHHIAPTQPRLGGPEALAGADATEWADWLPPQALWLPLCGPGGRQWGAVLFARDQPWGEAEATLLNRAAAMAGHNWAALHRPTPWQRLRARLTAQPRLRLGLIGLGLAALVLPVRLSVLAPAEIVAHAPAMVRAPAEGVIERVLIQPNQGVSVGQPLFELDRTTLTGRQEVARKALSTAQAELDQVTQQSFFDPKAKAQVAVIKARIDERAAELAQLDDLLGRAVVRAPRSGIAILDDPSEWLGRPVAVGERVMAVADPADIEIEAWLAPADIIHLETDGPVTVFLNSDPLRPVAASLRYLTYEPVMQPDGQLGHRVRATMRPGPAPPRLGLKGTARLDGHRVPLIYWLLRRPLAVIRTTLGF
jgi:hypothetical protein